MVLMHTFAFLPFPNPQTLLKKKNFFKERYTPSRRVRKEDNTYKILETGRYVNLADLRKIILKIRKPKTKPLHISQFTKGLKIGIRWMGEMV